MQVSDLHLRRCTHTRGQAYTCVQCAITVGREKTRTLLPRDTARNVCAQWMVVEQSISAITELRRCVCVVNFDKFLLARTQVQINWLIFFCIPFVEMKRKYVALQKFVTAPMLYINIELELLLFVSASIY